MKTKIQNLIRTSALTLSAAAVLSTAQAAQGPQPSICVRSCWGARAPTCSITQMAALTRATIHHTAGTGEYNTTSQAQSAANMRGIQNLHIDRGFCDIAYGFLVDKLGYIFEGRSGSMSSLPRGTHDACNFNSFGFTAMGYFHAPYNHAFTAAMEDSLYDVIAWRMPSSWSPYGAGTYCGNSVGFLDSHRKVSSTACPGDIIHNNYVTANMNGGPFRDGVNARKNSSAAAWSNWYSPVAGYSATAPGIVSTGGGNLAMFIQGGGNTLYHATWTGTWSGWMPLNGLAINSAASACSRVAGMIDVVVRGTDNNIWMRTWNGSSWNGWYVPKSGFAASAPSIVDTKDGKLSIFIQGGGGILYQAIWTGSNWTGWFSHGTGQPGIAAGAAPAACSRYPGWIDLVVRGTDNNIWMKNFNGSTWSGWYVPVAGYSASDPAIADTGSGTMSIFIVGGSSLVYQSKWNGTSWVPYASVSGGLGFANTTPAACSRYPGKIDVAVRGGVNAYTPADYIWMANYQ